MVKQVLAVLGTARNYNGLSLSQGHVGAMSWYVIVEFSDHFQAYHNFFSLRSEIFFLHHMYTSKPCVLVLKGRH